MSDVTNTPATKVIPVIPFVIEENKGIQSHFGFELAGLTLNLLVFSKTIVAVEGKDTAQFVLVAKVPMGTMSSYKELETIAGHLRWSVDQLKRKVAFAKQSQVDLQINTIISEAKAKSEADALKVAQLAAQTAAAVAANAAPVTPAAEIITPAANQENVTETGANTDQSSEPALQEQNTSGSEEQQS